MKRSCRSVPVVVFVAARARAEARRSTSRTSSTARSTRPGTLQLLALCLLFGGLALTYDLLFGFTGLLSFGHALYFAVGVYLADDRDHQVALEVLAGARSSPRSSAFVLAARPRRRLAPRRRHRVRDGDARLRAGRRDRSRSRIRTAGRGGEEGLGADYTKLPDGARRDLQHEEPLLARARLRSRSSSSIVRWAVDSSPGRVWQAIRENELRVEVLGLRPVSYKLMSFVLASFLATAGGSSTCSCSAARRPRHVRRTSRSRCSLMVVIGGTGTRWGALLGGILYT